MSSPSSARFHEPESAEAGHPDVRHAIEEAFLHALRTAVPPWVHLTAVFPCGYLRRPENRSMRRNNLKKLFVNPVPCTACLCCQTVCALCRTGQQDRDGAVIRVAVDVFGGDHRLAWCRQCEDAPCASACPAGAILQDSTTGAWTVDRKLCTSCKACVAACPCGAMFWNPSAGRPEKCDLCGGSPRCAAACAFGAVRFLDPDDPEAGFEGMPPSEQDPLLGRGPSE